VPSSDPDVVVTPRIGHELNNLLTVILGNAALLRMDLPDDSPSRAYLDQIDEAVRRAVELTGQIQDPPHD
jgi:two-component system, cell cycle sensor histidine kinase and response regulator CckA